MLHCRVGMQQVVEEERRTQAAADTLAKKTAHELAQELIANGASATLVAPANVADEDQVKDMVQVR